MLRVTSQLPKLHVVTDNKMMHLPDLDTRAAAMAQSRNVALHARAPGQPGRILTDLAERLRRTTESAGAPLFVNDRADVALLVEADGLHLPAAGLPIRAARALVGDAVWIGSSVHHHEEALRAADEGADYVFLGPIWETPSHPNQAALGAAAIERAQAARVIAIGGITTARVADCLSAGAYGVAAISALWKSQDPGSVAREMLLLLRNSSP